MKKVLLFLATLVFCLTAYASEINMKKTAMQTCIELLPRGYEFDVTLKTKIDTSNTISELRWEIEMGDGKGEEESDAVDDEKDKTIEPFIECLLPLIS